MERGEREAVITRRQSLRIAGASMASAMLPTAALARTGRLIPQRPSARVIVDNDFAGDPDGLVALAHQLFSAKTRTVLITSSALEPRFTDTKLKGRSASAGREVALDLLRRAKIKSAPPVAAGSELPSVSGAGPSAAARAIVVEAMRDDPLPLFFTCGGPLTNLAEALAIEPSIASRMTVVWIGGGAYPAGGWEYNLSVDGDAARRVIEQSRVPLWQIPQTTYRQMQYPISALREQLRGLSDFGDWLYDRFTTPPDFIDIGGAWPFGDSPLVLLTAISAESSTYTDRPALRILPNLHYGEALPERHVRVFEQLDARLAFDDFFALMHLHARGQL